MPDGEVAAVLIDDDRMIRTLALAMDDNEATPLIATTIRSADASAAAAYLVLVIMYPDVEPDARTVVHRVLSRTRSGSGSAGSGPGEAARHGRALATRLQIAAGLGCSRHCRRRHPDRSDVPTLALYGELGAAADPLSSSRLATLSNRVEGEVSDAGYASALSGGGSRRTYASRSCKTPGPLEVNACTSQDPPIALLSDPLGLNPLLPLVCHLTRIEA